MTFRDVVEAIKSLSTDEMQEIQLLLMVSFTERPNATRIISARVVT